MLKKLALTFFFCLACLAAEPMFWPEVTIGEEEAQTPAPGEPDGIIDGVDYYQLEEYERFDFGDAFSTQRQAQEQQDQEQRQEPTDFVREIFEQDPYWEVYKNDHDTYQEIQTYRLRKWQQETGRLPLD